MTFEEWWNGGKMLEHIETRLGETLRKDLARASWNAGRADGLAGYHRACEAVRRCHELSSYGCACDLCVFARIYKPGGAKKDG